MILFRQPVSFARYKEIYRSYGFASNILNLRPETSLISFFNASGAQGSYTRCPMKRPMILIFCCFRNPKPTILMSVTICYGFITKINLSIVYRYTHSFKIYKDLQSVIIWEESFRIHYTIPYQERTSHCYQCVAVVGF